MNATKYDTRTTAAHTLAGHAFDVACQAAHHARLNGADATTAALVHAETYAAAMRGER